MEQPMQGGKKCGCPHHRMVPVFVILFGLLFLFNVLGLVSAYAVAITWPIIVIATGLTKLTSSRCRCCPND